jgi:nicotinamidase-related amidase
MPHSNILDISTTALVVVDIQEAFRSAVPVFPLIASRASVAVRGFLTLGVPVIVTEQYPKGLGRTAEEILLVLPDDFEVFEKTAFSSCGASPFVDKLEELGVKQVVLCGLEAHVCVNQTAHDLLDRGYQVHVLTDCVCSRFEHDQDAGLDKMKASGVVTSSIEMAFFELMSDSRHDKFKEIQALIK